ncbi:MAG: peroxiredoxin [Deltaproteobacteria bacterium]|jgi:peroxiredoxin Q/BCP|nr:peroxiredoxin [Deltaproteobacteria bacterium]
MTSLEIGKKFPAFSLMGQDDKKTSLKDLRGKWAVLYFYPKDNSSGCSLEAGEFSHLEPEFKKLGASVFGVSPDSSKSHDNFIEKKSLTIPLLSDPEHALLEKAGAWREKKMYGREFMGVVRSTFLIDPDGKIAFRWDKVKAAGHAKEVLAKLKELMGK